PDAASLLPGSLVTTRTGLAPAGGDELTNTRESDHQAHRPPIHSRMPSGHAVVDPPTRLAWREVESGMLTDITFHDRADGTTEVVTTQRRGPPPHPPPPGQAGLAPPPDNDPAHPAPPQAPDRPPARAA